MTGILSRKVFEPSFAKLGKHNMPIEITSSQPISLDGWRIPHPGWHLPNKNSTQPFGTSAVQSAFTFFFSHTDLPATRAFRIAVSTSSRFSSLNEKHCTTRFWHRQYPCSPSHPSSPKTPEKVSINSPESLGKSRKVPLPSAISSSLALNLRPPSPSPNRDHYPQFPSIL